MLVLTRRTNEKIIIPIGEDKIEIVIAQIRGDKVRLGVEAPQEVKIYREEVYLRDQAAKQQVEEAAAESAS